MARLLAELGKDKIVNTVNPDGVTLQEVKFGKADWAEGRAKGNGITVEEIAPRRCNLLKRDYLSSRYNGVSFACAILNKPTGAVINVDGMANALVR
jgi:hypothetical protein